MPVPSQLIASMVPDLKSSMVKSFKNLAEPVDQQSGQTGPIALTHAPVAPSDNNSDFLLNQKQNHVLAQPPPIHAVSISSIDLYVDSLGALFSKISPQVGAVWVKMKILSMFKHRKK